ncbi:rhamnan synthesis F family protein [Desulfitobacterium hafniense]|uniref:rhamnan synthesis F family protein n=1 Tax=Desulfitobacterium hafniense TaxID=49338 RepID=UPI00037CB664|nr:rhamnan synthesis F family protein [Desulfitobacterium hafniense]
MKRFAIYFFYDRDGVVDDYVSFFLQELSRNIQSLCVVCNGVLSDEGRRKLEVFTSQIIVRENKGYDAWAYKIALEVIGFKNLEEYDEVILLNHTIMGPLYPFSEMFEEMASRNIDFWGITTYNNYPTNPYKRINGLNYIPVHIQSHFIVIRKSMFSSPDFSNYWRNLPQVNSYEDSVALHEMLFTKRFEDKGFTWMTYTGTENMELRSPCPIIMMPLELVKERKCPVFKRRSFFHDYRELLHYTNGQQASELLEYIKNKMSYDTDLIWQNILRTCNHSDVKRCLHLNYILPDKNSIRNIELKTIKRLALIIHIYSEDLIDYCKKYAESMPEDADIIITTDTKEKELLVKKAFSSVSCRKMECVLVENRGRDISALLVGCAKYMTNYDVVCFAHDKKVRQLDYGIQGESYSYHCFENILRSRYYVENILDTFERNPRLGLLMPPPPNFGTYYGTIGGFDWGCNYENTEELIRRLGWNVDINLSVEPTAPFGTMFWFRPEALKPLTERAWSYEDFPPEPNRVDGTILHAIERSYPFAAQQAGFYSAWVLTDTYAKVQLTNYHYMLRELNRRLLPVYHPSDFNQLIQALESRPGLLRLLLKALLPEKVYNNLRSLKQIFTNKGYWK